MTELNPEMTMINTHELLLLRDRLATAIDNNVYLNNEIVSLQGRLDDALEQLRRNYE